MCRLLEACALFKLSACVSTWDIDQVEAFIAKQAGDAQ